MRNRLEEIKNGIAKNNGYQSFEELLNNNSFGCSEIIANGFNKTIDSIAIQYARECIKASLEKASENGNLLVTDFMRNNTTKTLNTFFDKSVKGDTERKVELNKESIVQESNIVIL